MTMAGVLTLPKNQYANYSIEEFRRGAERSRSPDMAISKKKSIAATTRCAIRSGSQTAEQMDSRRSIYSGRGAACGRCRVG